MYVGTAKTDITPIEANLPLGGSVAGEPVGERVESRLEANILALGDAENEPTTIVISVDLLYAGKEIPTHVRTALSDYEPCTVIVAASHTHQAPMVDSSKPLLGEYSSTYSTWVSQKISEAVREAVSNAERATVAVGTSMADHSVNRRKRVLAQLGRRVSLNTVAIAPNPKGPNDETITTIRFLASDGTTRALIWNYACHPVGFPSKNEISAHYPGVVRDELRSLYVNDSLPIVFLQGFSGDVRPRVPYSTSKWTNLWTTLTGRGVPSTMTRGEYEAWAHSLAQSTMQAIEAEAEAVEATELAIDSRTCSLSGIIDGPVDSYDVVALAIDKALLIMVSAEAMSEWSVNLRQRFASYTVVPVGCINHCVGYIPTAQMITEGGYEGGGFAQYFGVQKLSCRAPEIVMSTISEVTSKIERHSGYDAGGAE